MSKVRIAGLVVLLLAGTFVARPAFAASLFPASPPSAFGDAFADHCLANPVCQPLIPIPQLQRRQLFDQLFCALVSAIDVSDETRLELGKRCEDPPVIAIVTCDGSDCLCTGQEDCACMAKFCAHEHIDPVDHVGLGSGCVGFTQAFCNIHLPF